MGGTAVELVAHPPPSMSLLYVTLKGGGNLELLKLVCFAVYLTCPI